jgi:iron complex transport system substrate-binding protein
LRFLKSMRIVSLLPSATEILYALGLDDCVVGVTHECDYPGAAALKPALIKPRVDPTASPAEIDRQVSELVSRGESIYAVDAELLSALKPDLIITQDLCHVCAASSDDLATALSRFDAQPRVVTLTPHSLADVWQNILDVGNATGTAERATALVGGLERRIRRSEAAVEGSETRPRVVCLEWLEPLYVAGHWVPEMVAKAGGADALGKSFEPSFKVTSEDVAASAADVVLIMLCGYNAGKNAAEFAKSQIPDEWEDLPAARENRFYAVDANSYFSRPGPRLADGVEILAHLLHGQFDSAELRPGAWERLELGGDSLRSSNAAKVSAGRQG